MAEPDLIDDYVANLRRQIRWRSDVDEVLDEVQDHLREAAEAQYAAGIDQREAQRRTLVRFGDPELIHRAFSVAPSGGVVMPSAFTRIAGAVAFVAAGLWVAAAVLKWWESGLFAPWTTDRYTIFALVVAAAAVTSIIAMAGILARIGWPNSNSGIAIALAALGFLGLMGVTWMWPIVGLFLGAAFLMTLLALNRSGEHPGRLQWSLALAWPLGFVTLVLLSVVGLGPVDEYGDFPMAVAVGFSVAAVCMLVGLVDIGRWLVAERSLDPSPVTIV